MILKECNISGFGKLKDKKISLKKGMNIFCEDNGYGKSTLATFIKVMLYGFDDENKRSNKDKEREKYRPWNRGTYGGSMIFEAFGSDYEVSRTFGRNENEDTFEVRKLPENTIVDTFDKQSLGIQVFGIDKDSFFRTAYIASSDINKKSDAVTDSIRAKLGNLTDATDDINNFETACAKVEKKMNELTPDRKSGRIKSLKTEIADKNNRLRTLEDTQKATEILENQIKAQIQRIESDKEKVKELEKQAKIVQDSQTILTKRKMHQNIREEYEAVKEKKDVIETMFQHSVPKVDDINVMRQKCIRQKHLTENMKANDFPKDENWLRLKDRFKNGICADEEVRRYITLWDECCEKERENVTKEKELQNEVNDHIEKCMKKAEEDYEEGLLRYKESEKKRKRKLLLFATLAVLLFCVAIALTVLGILGMRRQNILIPEVISFVGGILFVALIFILKLNKKEKFDKNRESDITSNEALNHVDPASLRRNAIESGKRETILINSQVKNFLEKYNSVFNEETVKEDLLDLNEDARAYSDKKKKEEEYRKNEEEYRKTDEELDDFFDKCHVKRMDDCEWQLEEFSQQAVKYAQYSEDFDKKKLSLEKFEEENDITRLYIEIPDDLPDIEDVNDEEAELRDELEKENEMLISFRNRLEVQQEERDGLLDLAASLEDDKELLSKYEEDYMLLSKTLEYLEKAKNALSLKYTGPTMEGFRKYCSYFAKEDAEEFRIDTDLNLTKTEVGMQRRMNDLSLGLREVTDFCLRLALIDAMYEKEKPFIILDDPFVNFDPSNLEGAAEVLKRVSDESQVLYFTCHDSRKIMVEHPFG